MAFTRNPKYDKILAAWKADPSQSYAKMCAKAGVSYQYLFRYKRKLEQAESAGLVASTRVILKRDGKEIKRSVVPQPKAVKKIDEGGWVNIRVPRSEIVDMIIHDRHQVVIPSEKVFQAISSSEMAEIDAQVGRLKREMMKKPQSVELTPSSGKQGGFLNKGE
jgi:hypothetical protein